MTGRLLGPHPTNRAALTTPDSVQLDRFLRLGELQHVQLADVCLDLEGCRPWKDTSDGARASFEAFSRSRNFYSRNRPVNVGSEIAVLSVMLVGPTHPDEPNIEVRIDGKPALRFPQAVLRPYSMKHADPERLQQLINAMKDFKLDDAGVSLAILIARVLEVPEIGFRLRVPLQLRDNSDVTVEGLAFDNRLYLLGIEKRDVP